MRATDWNDYELLDASDGGRLECWGEVILIRPDPQTIWKTLYERPMWERAHARYLRPSTGGGRWEEHRTVSGMWKIKYCKLMFQLKTTDFKHIGIFPEQAVSWDFVGKKTWEVGRPVKVLSLSGYTGAATLVCVSAGVEVCHADASKGIVAQARGNAAASSFLDKPAHWLVDDCVKFVQREQRRDNTYNGTIMDPSSYGRGPGGEVRELEEQLYPLVQLYVPPPLKDTLSFVLNSYTTGLSPSVMTYLLGILLQTQLGGSVPADEIELPTTQNSLVLSCSNTTIWVD